jgi:iduronate 2-sulfatase
MFGTMRSVSVIRRLFLVLATSLLLLVSVDIEAFAAERPNVLLLCIDDLRPELGCFGKDYVSSPNIDRLARHGRAFHRHYVQAPTCGASRYALLTGQYGRYGNGALFQRGQQLLKEKNARPPSFPGWFQRHGYTTVSVGKVSHHPGGRGGRDWNDDSQPEMPHSWDRHLMPVGPWRHPRGAMHGLANGEIREKAGEMDVYQAIAGADSIYPDGMTTDEALKQLDELTQQESKKPFFLAVGIIRPHLPFGAPAKYLAPYRQAELPAIPHPSKPAGKTTWHGSGEFMKYNRWKRNPNKDAEFATEVRRHYAACVSYADSQVGRIMHQLKECGAADNTIVVLWGDHGWHLGEHSVWGKHTLFEESLRSPLIVSYPGQPSQGQATKSIVETIDIFPTVCDLAGLPQPGFVDGVSLRPILEQPSAPGHPAISYKRERTIRTDEYRLISHLGGHLELYDHRQKDAETRNIAQDRPAVAQALLSELNRRLDDKSSFKPDQRRLPVAPPDDAVVLFDNGQLNAFRSMNGDAAKWTIEGGELVSGHGKGRKNHLVSALHFRDAEIHVEFALPEAGPGNSGVYIHGNYELQIFNSFGREKISKEDMGSVYGFAPPLVNVCRAPGEWQVYDIRYRAPRRDGEEQIVTPGSITAWLNGHKVQDRLRFGEPRSKYHPYRYGTTPWLQTIWKQQKKTSVGPVFLQDHGDPVRFRNVWVRPLDEEHYVYEQ